MLHHGSEVMLRRTCGTYKIAKVQKHNRFLYAALPDKDLVRLYKGGVTSSNAYRWELIDESDSYFSDSFGRLITEVHV